MKQGSIAVVASALVQDVRWRVKIDDNAGFPQTLPILKREHRSAAGGKHKVRFAGKLNQYLAFAPSEARFAFDLEYDGNAHAGSRLDFMVAVQKSAL